MRLLILLLLLSAPFAVAATAHAGMDEAGKKEKIVGTVVAHARDFPRCAHDVCGLWLIVRLDAKKGNRPSYVVVNYEYVPNKRLLDEGFPNELVERSRRWEFKVIRKPEWDGSIGKYKMVIDGDTGEDLSEESAVPVWELLPGAEGESLPFGKVVPFFYMGAEDFRNK
jgi:hypothetical protein